MSTSPIPSPTQTALRIAKALYPTGLASYCYDTPEQNDRAMQADLEGVARKIDAAGELPKLNDLLRRSLATIELVVENYPAAGYDPLPALCRDIHAAISV